jgi:pimeloyl-ACP methyl ester carboxylesterase
MPTSPSPPLGPVETSILSELSPTFTARLTESAAGPLRILEGGVGPPLVLIHGRGGAATTWFSWLPKLAQRFRVFAVDLPGFGSSSAPPFTGGDFEAGIDFFTAPIEAWIEGEGFGAPTLMGHSLGGLVAVELALRGRVSPRRLVLIGAMGLGPQMTYLSRIFFRAGPERLARRLGPTLFNRIVPAIDTPEGRRHAALDYELSTASEHKRRRARL